jgi:hypothetical protein
VNEKATSPLTPDRRDLVKAGAGVLAALGGLRVVTSLHAQDGTPSPVAGRYLNGHFGVTRSYVVKEDADVDALISSAEGYADIVASIEGFATYAIFYNDATRVWTAVVIFDTQEHAEASTTAAADYVDEQRLGAYFENPSPVVVEGRVVVNRGF